MIINGPGAHSVLTCRAASQPWFPLLSTGDGKRELDSHASEVANICVALLVVPEVHLAWAVLCGEEL